MSYWIVHSIGRFDCEVGLQSIALSCTVFLPFRSQFRDYEPVKRATDSAHARHIEHVQCLILVDNNSIIIVVAG